MASRLCQSLLSPKLVARFISALGTCMRCKSVQIGRYLIGSPSTYRSKSRYQDLMV